MGGYCIMYDNRKEENMVIKEEDTKMTQDTIMSNTTTPMYTEIKFSQFFNQYTPQIIRDNFSNLRGFVNNSNGSIWFIGREISILLGYSDSDPRKAIRRFVSEQNLIRQNTGSNTNRGRGQGAKYLILISEQGLYELCTQSELKNPKIVEFRQWIYNTIVNMRQNGISISEEFRNQLNHMSNEELRQRILQDRGKVDYYNRMMDDNDHTIPLSGIAAELGITPQELNNYLSSIGFHKRMGKTSNYIPKKEYIDEGMVIVRKKEILDENGIPFRAPYTIGYTEKGRDYIIKLYTNQPLDYKPDYQLRYANNVHYIAPQPIINNYYNIFVTEPSSIPTIIQSLPQPQYYQPNTPINNLPNCPIEYIDKDTRSKYSTYKEYEESYNKRYKK